MMDALFGKKKSPKEIMREYKRGIDRTIRELDRERTKMQSQEKKLISDMKKMAKQNQMDAVKIMAKDLVRTRNYITKFYRMRAQMQAVSLRLQTLRSTQQMNEAMKGVTKTMMVMNKRMNIPQMQRIMMEFQKQSEMMDMKEEVMNDSIDDAFEEDEDEEEEEGLVNAVLDEIGLDLSGKLGNTPGNKLESGEKDASADNDLQNRLDSLRKG
eukprot:gb/GECH01011389.1/.p1 GENE.gb/GECH01011389.1/~~gb/GECH01011389.1/.p1  ORF type:complete len:212 (+),score=68.82 gb/GECH01011389.1/:1-636(+)